MGDPDEFCTRCGSRTVAGLSAGICPKCLLRLGLEHGAGSDDPSSGSLPTETAEEPNGSPREIGPYRILGILGEGGMGIVYLAEQAEPLRRRVALKVIKPGMDTLEVLARFDAERQALAVMSHPKVAKVFEAGTTEQGRPYFVMEYVPGVRITEYCDMRCLSVRERLELFTEVCDAIQHAHQKGVIHRDIKPSNVLVASEDGKAILKVIDFGLAKAMGQPLTARTRFTRHGVLIGTPEYMSPEQAGKAAQDVDARTDIYSLGVLLYELLVGALPFDPETLRRAAAVEMLRILQEEEPPSPTTKFDSLGNSAPEVARRRHTDVRSLVRELRGDMEWITMRALEKDPAQRYASASELAADIRRHLDDEPVLARPATRRYRLRKLVRKHRLAFTASAAGLSLLVLGVVVSTVFYVRSEMARQHAATEARRIAVEAEALQAALLWDADRYQTLSRQAMALHRSALGTQDPALAIYMVNRLAILKLFADDPLSAIVDGTKERELEREALHLVNNALEKGDPDALKAAALLIDLLEPGDADSLARRALAGTRGGLANPDRDTLESAERLVGRLQRAAVRPNSASDDEVFEEVYRKSLDRLERALPANSPAWAETRRSLASVLERKASRLWRSGDAAEAASALREALNLLGGGYPGASERIAKLRSELGAVLIALGQFEDAEKLLLGVIPVLEKERGDNNAATQIARSRLANLYAAWERPSDATRVRTALPRFFIEEASDLGPLLFDEPVTSRDGVYSALLHGQSVWIFGGTILSRPAEDGTTRRQATLVWTEDLAASDGLAPLRELEDDAGAPIEFLTLTNEDRAFNDAHSGEDCSEPCGAAWFLVPGAIVADPDRDRLLVFYRRVLRRGTEEPERGGASLAAWTPGSLTSDRPSIRFDADPPRILFGPDEPAWGSAALTVDGQLYVYGCEARGLSCSCFLARAPIAAALDLSAWRFFAADGRWSTDWTDARPVLTGGIQSGILSVHWNPYLGKFMAIYSRVVDSRVTIRVADHPEGPWSDAAIEIDTLHSGPGWSWTTWGLAHPELARDGGRTEYVTYRRNAGAREIRLMEVRFGRK